MGLLATEHGRTGMVDHPVHHWHANLASRTDGGTVPHARD